ncbi:cell division protein FtsK [Streptomyces alfalfae]|uniref:Cell division protein FtsK n=1 Tax=Streptomyces alfalfae TaxID=1642299 RepID=A0ABM6GTS5_9ACTN|nr:FtsK/SpoIIIE domain-containing protein [Streptomyces alfalfae]APY86973.1 cell division protein FtsK [Streptomyces alfalfae]AYA17363.1 cell division protein FtsK [Streptomyces fradiae]RXX37129.1 cell division protein FtsK [Streptomyces alfalfae]RZM87383.1 cell division protein FtsK [Streptomyces alfalfae]
MRVLVTVVREGIAPQDVMVTLEDEATVGDVAACLGGADLASSPHLAVGRLPSAIRAAAAGAGFAASKSPFHQSATAPSLWVDGRHCDPSDAASSVLRDGVRVTTDEAIGPFMRAGEPTGRFELRVCGGPDAGRIARVQVGVATLGSGPACSLSVADTTLAPLAAKLSVNVDGGVTIHPQPGASLTLDDEPVEADRAWPLDSLVKAGDSLIVLREAEEPDAHLAATDDGGYAYNRPPRLSPLRQRPRVVLPAEPVKGEGPRLQLFASFIPAVFGLVMYFMTKQIYTLLFCAMSPLMMIGYWVGEARHERKRHKKAVKEYKKALVEYDVKLGELAEADQRARRESHPDPAQVLLFATGPRRRLWERRLVDPDVLQLRVGMADLPVDVEMRAVKTGAFDDPPEPPVVTHVPAVVPLAELGVIGVAGDRRLSLTMARWLVAQATVLHSPRDLSLVVLSSAGDARAAWEWAHWLPHTVPQLGQDCISLIGSEPEVVGRRVHELLAELERRKAGARDFGASKSLRPDPFTLVVLDGARLLRRMPGVPQLLQEGPGHGIFALCVDEDERLLPEECKAAISGLPDRPNHVGIGGGGLESVGDVLADQVSPAWCELVARSLAPVRDVSLDDADAALPTSARLLSLLGLPDPTGADVAGIWQRGGSTTEVPIGIAGDGPFLLDIRRDGPHALVAGTTGAGKSELLQTIITSLALANRPDALNFVLIDYKGGSAFLDCARLPHTVGMVSDLDAHLTERALASLAAELKRREEILFDTAAKDIEDYNDTRKVRPELEPMPRLVLVIDEFASLVAELPDFIAGLVDIARRGRSLGVHLILATQRPAGVVSADIRANTNLRIALRVTDGAESSDVIDAPDAGSIAKSTPGRAYVRSGAQSLVAVQSARIGGRRPSVGSHRPRAVAALVSWASFGRPVPRVVEDGDDGTLVTDLSVLVGAIRDGAELMRFGPQRSPWLEPLTDVLSLADLPEAVPPTTDEVAPIHIGLTDLPAQQSRAPLALDLVHGDHIMLAGGPRSGRSTALRTLAGALASTTSPADVHLYGIDCGANALLPLTNLPHCGAVVTRDQPGRVRRLLDRLAAEVSRRQQLLAMEGLSSATEQRATAAPEDRLPWMVLLLDGWEGYTSALEGIDYGRLVEMIVKIFREGAAVGLKVVMTADRSGFSGQVSPSFADKLILRLTDANEYSLAGLSARDVPKSMPPGRALRITDAGAQESQIALLDPDPSGQAQVAALRAIAEEARRRHPVLPRDRRPLRVDELPMRVTASQARALDPSFTPPSPLWTLLCVGGDELTPIGVDLDESGPGFVIAGPPKSGRSTALVVAARSLLASQVPLVLVTPRRSPLRDLENEPGVLGVLTADSSERELTALIEGAGGGKYAVVADDADMLYDTSLDRALEEVAQNGRDGGIGIVVAGATDTLNSQYRGFVVEARRSRQGMILAPQSASDGELFNVRLSIDGGGPVGRGLLIQSGQMTPVQAILDD